MSGLLSRLHGGTIHRRRVRALCRQIAALIPDGATVVDVGCGDGQLGALLQQARPDIALKGVDVLVRPNTFIPVSPFDGNRLPFDDNSCGAVLLIDVLHHCDDPTAVLRDCARVARDAIIIKDHLADGFLAVPTLRVMDFVGNAGHGVALPYNYWTREQWTTAFTTLALQVEHWSERLGLYPGPVDWVFGRSLHFLARFAPSGSPGHADA